MTKAGSLKLLCISSVDIVQIDDLLKGGPMGISIFKRNKAVTVESAGEDGTKPIIDLRNVVETNSNAALDFPVLKEIDAQINSGE
jgi:hypothetical protein